MNAELQTSHPKGKLGMSDASSLSRISALSFHFTLLSPLLFFCLRPLLFLSSLLFFFSFFFFFLLFFSCLLAHFHGFIVPENSSIFSIESQALRYGTCVAGRRWQLVHGVYTGICHYAFMSSEKKSCSVHSCFVKCLIWCRWFRWKSTISASPSIMCFFFFFNREDIWSTISSKICVWCLYALFYICVETNFVDFEEIFRIMTFVQNKQGLHWRSFPVLMYSFVVDRAQNAN